MSRVTSQVTQEVFKILDPIGYSFEQRGMVNIKGKGEMMTYYLIGGPASLTGQKREVA